MSIKKAVHKIKGILTNWTELENQKLTTMAKNKNMSKAVLCREMIKAQYLLENKKDL